MNVILGSLGVVVGVECVDQMRVVMVIIIQGRQRIRDVFMVMFRLLRATGNCYHIWLYRKIAGNRCMGGVDHEPFKISCDSSSSSGGY